MANPTNPTLVSPSNDSIIIGNVITFVFTIPTDEDNNNLVFRIELDTNNPINSLSSNYKKNESRFALDQQTQGKWEIQSGGNWISMPTGGVTSSYYSNNARVTLKRQDTLNYPDLDTAWYWRISAADGMLKNPIFNQVIFGQAIFGGI